MSAVGTREQPVRHAQRRPYEMLVDTDVHPVLREGIERVVPYMPKAWQETFRQLPPMTAPSGLGRPFPYTGYSLALDAQPPQGGPPGSDPRFMVEDFFDRYDVGIGQLILLEALVAAGSCADPEMSAVLISAFNDWMLDEFVIDPRMRYSLLVSSADAELAVAEIRRLGPNPSVCSVAISPVAGKPLGDKHYRPILEAAVEHGLPMMAHGGGKVPTGSETYIEDRVNVALGGWVNVNSLVMQGVFERYPSLKVMIVECGFSWVVPLMWRMDAAWRRNRVDVPWLKKWPSEYIRDHIRLATQPVDDDPDAAELYRLIEVEKSHLADILVYSSDYPHWDNDRPGRVLNTLSNATKAKIFCDNAKATLRL